MSTPKTLNNITSSSNMTITVENGIVNSLSYSDNKSDGTTQQYTCAIKSETPCTGITLDSDAKTFHFNQTKLTGGLVLIGTLKHAGA